MRYVESTQPLTSDKLEVKFPAIAYIDVASSVLPLGAALYGWRWLARERLVFFFFTTIALITELATLWMALRGITNLWVLQFYNLSELLLMLVVFSAWQKRKALRTSYWWAGAFFAVFWVAAKWAGLESFSRPAHYTHTVSSAILVVIATLTLLDVIRGEDVELLRDMRFWVASGALLYFAGNIMLFLLSGRIAILGINDAMTVYSIHWIIDSVANVLYAGAFLCMKRQVA